MKRWLSNTSAGIGTFFGVACPACVPAVAALFSALGLGFMINMKILAPLTIVLLGTGLVGFHQNAKKHGQKKYFMVATGAALAVFIFRYIIEFTPALYLGAAVMFIAAILDYKTAKQKKSCDIKKH